MRKYILFIFLALCFGLLAFNAFTQPEDKALQHANELLSSTLLFDGHNDLMWTIRENIGVPGDLEKYDLNKRTNTDTDIPRLKQGGLNAQFWSVWIPADSVYNYSQVQLEQIDLAHRVFERYPQTFRLALTAADVEQAYKEGLIASLIGVEGGHAIENSLGLLRAYYDLGARYMTLTHYKTLDWADAATDTARHGGLTPFGKEVVREMNRLGMLVDLSHVSDQTMSDALDVSEAPVIFSHSSARALTNHKRNVPDSILVRMPQNGGVVMVTFIPLYVSTEVLQWSAADEAFRANNPTAEALAAFRKKYPLPKATLSQVADHLDYVRKMAGIDHIGLGSDYYGSGRMPLGLEDVSKFPDLFAELIRRGWSDDDLRKLASGNILRVIRKAEDVARDLQTRRSASGRSIEEMDKNSY